MSTETIQAGNRLIADFDPEMRIDPTDPKKESYYRGLNWVHLRDLEYHSSWEWLMPIVEKVEKYCRVEISTPQICIWYKYEDELKSEDGFYCSIPTHGKEKIKVLFTAIVQFIEWYNSTTELSKPLKP